ncbi:TetR/AcrR family transcriptional regulator [Amycolatopsis sp. NPDC003676]
MPRPREFDETEALEGAMNAFWARGYESTSTEELCAATGLGRSSIYNTFSSKHELFRRVLDHYSHRGIRLRETLLDNAPDGLGAIRLLLTSTIDDELENGRRGCLMVNAIAEFGTTDPEVAAQVNADTEAHLSALTHFARTGQADGSITRDRDAAEIANFIHATISGIRTMSRRGAEQEALTSVAEIATSAVSRR